VINSNCFGVIAAFVQIPDTLRFRATLWGLRDTYYIYLGLIGKRVVELLLVLIDLFSLGVTADSLRTKIENRRFRSNAVTLIQNFT